MQATASMYVYSIKSINHPKFYIGITADPKQRLADHNNGKSPHTSKYKPWKMAVCVWFADEQKAKDFEKYLKSGSGRAFSARHF
ncbi:GIY-YIG nuclease family protein [Bdellovibrio bacteriovorus]|uniref:GIY-YIG nuclease family protein n=1 Tax=Bdellovibrio bacteriovorus TaxID=959 RepID=UPI003D0231F9